MVKKKYSKNKRKFKKQQSKKYSKRSKKQLRKISKKQLRKRSKKQLIGGGIKLFSIGGNLFIGESLEDPEEQVETITLKEVKVVGSGLKIKHDPTQPYQDPYGSGSELGSGGTKTLWKPVVDPSSKKVVGYVNRDTKKTVRRPEDRVPADQPWEGDQVLGSIEYIDSFIKNKDGPRYKRREGLTSRGQELTHLDRRFFLVSVNGKVEGDLIQLNLDENDGESWKSKLKDKFINHIKDIEIDFFIGQREGGCGNPGGHVICNFDYTLYVSNEDGNVIFSEECQGQSCTVMS